MWMATRTHGNEGVSHAQLVAERGDTPGRDHGGLPTGGFGSGRGGWTSSGSGPHGASGTSAAVGGGSRPGVSSGLDQCRFARAAACDLGDDHQVIVTVENSSA